MRLFERMDVLRRYFLLQLGACFILQLITVHGQTEGSSQAVIFTTGPGEPVTTRDTTTDSSDSSSILPLIQSSFVTGDTKMLYRGGTSVTVMGKNFDQSYSPRLQITIYETGSSVQHKAQDCTVFTDNEMKCITPDISSLIPTKFESYKENWDIPLGKEYQIGGDKLIFYLGFEFNNVDKYAYYNSTSPGWKIMVSLRTPSVESLEEAKSFDPRDSTTISLYGKGLTEVDATDIDVWLGEDGIDKCENVTILNWNLLTCSPVNILPQLEGTEFAESALHRNITVYVGRNVKYEIGEIFYILPPDNTLYIIIGGAVGGGIVLILVIIGIICICRRRKNSDSDKKEERKEKKELKEKEKRVKKEQKEKEKREKKEQKEQEKKDKAEVNDKKEKSSVPSLPRNQSATFIQRDPSINKTETFQPAKSQQNGEPPGKKGNDYTLVKIKSKPKKDESDNKEQKENHVVTIDGDIKEQDESSTPAPVSERKINSETIINVGGNSAASVQSSNSQSQPNPVTENKPQSSPESPKASKPKVAPKPERKQQQQTTPREQTPPPRVVTPEPPAPCTTHRTADDDSEQDLYVNYSMPRNVGSGGQGLNSEPQYRPESTGGDDLYVNAETFRRQQTTQNTDSNPADSYDEENLYQNAGTFGSASPSQSQDEPLYGNV